MSAPTALPAEPLRPDEVPVAGYRSISWSAVLALILGTVSAVSLASPVLSPVAIAAGIAAVIAMRQIAASDGQLIGRTAALTGLCLATLFFGWGLSRYLTRQWALEEQGRKTADAWLALVQSGQLREALQFRLSPASRIMSAAALAEHYGKNQEAAQELSQFMSEPLIKDLAALRAQADTRYEAIANSRHNGLVDQLVLRYSYAKPSTAGERQNMWIQLRRDMDQNTGRPDWQVEAARTMALPGEEQ